MPDVALDDAALALRRRPVILSVVLLAVFVVSMDNSILNVALKTLAEAAPTGLGAGQGQLQWAVDAYVLAYAGLLLGSGLLGDRLGHKKLLLGGLVGFGLFSALCAHAPSPDWLVACRAAMGASAACLMPATLATVTHLYPGEGRARAIGLWSAATGAAIAAGPLVGGALLGRFWWGSVFLVNVPLIAVALALTAWLVPESRRSEPVRIDLPGLGLWIAGLSALVYGIIRAGDTGGWTHIAVFGPTVSGLALLVAFAAWELRCPQPSLDVSCFAKRPFSAAVGALCLLFFALMGGTFVMTFYLQSIRGYDAFQAGLCVLPLAGALIAFAPRAPKLVGRFGTRVVCTAGMAVAGAGFIALATLGRATPLWELELALFVFGTGMAHVLPPATVAIVSSMAEQEAGAASAINNTFRQVGASLGVAVLGSLLAALYHGRIDPGLQALPPALRSQARSSITATLEVAQRADAHALVLPAENAFVHAMRITWLIGALALFAGAIVVALLLQTGRAAARTR